MADHRWSRMGKGMFVPEAPELVDWCMRCGLIRYTDMQGKVVRYCIPSAWPSWYHPGPPPCDFAFSRSVRSKP